MSAEELVGRALEAHQRALALQEEMQQASAETGAAVRAALKAGAGAVALAEVLGVSRQRVYQMAGSSKR